MTGRASSPPVPAPRAVASWWTTLAPLGPTALLAGWFTILRVEVLVESSILVPLDPITSAILAVVASADGATAVAVDRVLRLGEARVRATLAAAGHLGYATEQSSGDAIRYTLTDAGRAALDHGLTSPIRSRRRFAFRNGQYLPLSDPGPLLLGHAQATSMGAGAGSRLVAAATARSPQWKADAHFPTDFQRVVAMEELPGPQRWQAVPGECPDAFQAVIVFAHAVGTPRVLGFPTASPDWPLAPTPIVEFRGEPARAAFPELFDTQPINDSRGAWLGWAKSRSVPLEPADAATVSLDGHKLTVTVTAEFGEWLRANRADVFAGETWVWVGEGDVRRAAVLDVQVG